MLECKSTGDKKWEASGDFFSLLLKIHYFNGQVVIAAGYDGMILRSMMVEIHLSSCRCKS
jgi:hypothetical protein